MSEEKSNYNDYLESVLDKVRDALFHAKDFDFKVEQKMTMDDAVMQQTTLIINGFGIYRKANE